MRAVKAATRMLRVNACRWHDSRSLSDTSAVPSQEQLPSSVAEISQPKKGLGAAARLMLDATRPAF
jgi:hypothetical protein